MVSMLAVLAVILLLIGLFTIWTGDTPVYVAFALIILHLVGMGNQHLVMAAIVGFVLVVTDFFYHHTDTIPAP